MSKQKYYLSSLDSYKFERPREFEIIKRITISESHSKNAWLVKITPNLLGQDYRLISDVDYLVLTPRHKGIEINSIAEFPCYVYIMLIKSNKISKESILNSDTLEIIAWGEIYLK
jgi:hypothetical protein